MTPYKQGRWAYNDGKAITVDPYGNPHAWPDPYASAEWRRGYMDASEAHAAQIEARGGNV